MPAEPLDPPNHALPAAPACCSTTSTHLDAAYCRPEIRWEAFAALLEGGELGAYDELMIEWLADWDDPTCRTVASLLWR